MATPAVPKDGTRAPAAVDLMMHRADDAVAVTAVAGGDDRALRLDQQVAGAVAGLVDVDGQRPGGAEGGVAGAGGGQRQQGVVGVGAVGGLVGGRAEDHDAAVRQDTEAPRRVADVGGVGDGLAGAEVDAGDALRAEGGVELALVVEAGDGDVGVLAVVAGRAGRVLDGPGDRRSCRRPGRRQPRAISAVLPPTATLTVATPLVPKVVSSAPSAVEAGERERLVAALGHEAGGVELAVAARRPRP